MAKIAGTFRQFLLKNCYNFPAVFLYLPKITGNMQTLITLFRQNLELTPMAFLRSFHSKINWDCRLIGILGQKGVGKSTLMLQHIKQNDDLSETLYVSADDIYFSTHSLFSLAYEFHSKGGRKLYIDEIHKYRGWSQQIKQIYDQLPLLKVVYSGSSILDLERGGGDLIRRTIEYHLPVLSFREYLNLRNGWNLETAGLDEILAGKVDFPYGEYRPLKYFEEYKQCGCYPFFNEPEFAIRLRRVISTTVEYDIPKFAEMTLASTDKLKKLMYYISQSVPVKINYSQMERDLGLDRNELPKYIEYLEKAELLTALRLKTNGDSILRKMDKIYLENSNMLQVLGGDDSNVGNIRETLFLCWMKRGFDVLESPVSDFEIDGKTFEVGGKSKGKKQILSAAEGYIVKDDIEYAYENQIPLWMFGFIY